MKKENPIFLDETYRVEENKTLQDLETREGITKEELQHVMQGYYIFGYIRALDNMSGFLEAEAIKISSKE